MPDGAAWRPRPGHPPRDSASLICPTHPGHYEQVLKQAVVLSPDVGYEKYLYLGQLLESPEDALAATRKGVQVLQVRSSLTDEGWGRATWMETWRQIEDRWLVEGCGLGCGSVVTRKYCRDDQGR